MEFEHKPIMLIEALSGLNISPDGVYVDCTIGGAGHSTEIIKRLTKNGLLIGIDKDSDAIAVCQERLKEFNNKIIIKDDFKNIQQILTCLNIRKVDGFLIDLGVSSYQLDNSERGFSFRADGKLDMRMNQEQELSAYNVVNEYDENRLIKILFEYGEETFARQIVRNIIKHRQIKPIQTTLELKSIIEESLPKKVVYKSGGCSKKTFQAIRIEVNGELNKLKESIDYMISTLNKGGRIVILTFHSLEDRIVKNILKDKATACICPPKTPVCICGHKQQMKLITKKPFVASKEEQLYNPRSTSAKLRIAEKI